MEENKSKFLYLDDNDKVTRDGDVAYINNSSNCIIIETDYPNSWKKRSEQIMQNLNHYEGLILDWEFTNMSQEAKQGCQDAEDVDFTPEAIAEHIRIQAAQGNIKDIPIIICSADRNKAFSSLRKKEQSSKDLFDLAFIKNDIFNNDTTNIEKQLCDLARTYANLQKQKYSLNRLLGINDEDLKKIDPRFLDTLQTLLEDKTVHDLVQFFLREVIEAEGILIDEDVLAARLGIDLHESKEEWSKLTNIISDKSLQYKGFLSHGWQRFWAFKLTDWFQSLNADFDLKTSKASKRVNFLNQKFDLKLQVAPKIKFCTSEEYWTVCYGTKKPIDPINAYQIGNYQLYPWQNAQYVSGYAELEKTDTTAWKINIMDRERFNKFRTKINENISL